MIKQIPLSHNKQTSFLWLLVLVLPICLYGSIVAYLHQNLPIYDDYIVQLEIAKILNAQSVREKFGILFSQLNEHRVTYTRFWFLVTYFLTGNLSYSALIFIGNLSLVGILMVFFWWIRDLGISYWALTCVAWLLFQFQFYENSMWAMASLQNLTIHFFYVLLFTLLAFRSRKMLLWSIVMGAVICYTSGNGFLALGVGSLSLIIQRRWQHLMVWVVFTVALSLFYFLDYHSFGGKESVAGMVAPLSDKVLGFLAFLGQGLVFHSGMGGQTFVVVSGGVLAFLCAVAAFVILKKLFKLFASGEVPDNEDLFSLVLLQCMAFVLVSAAALSYSRIEAGNPFGAVNTRYQLYPTMLIISLFCFLLVSCKRSVKRVLLIALPISVLIWLLIFQRNIPGLYHFRNNALISYYNTTSLEHPDSAIISRVFKPDPENQKELQLISEALKQPLHDNKEFPLQLNGHSVDCRTCPNSLAPDETVFIVIGQWPRQILYPVRRNGNGGVRSFWLYGKLFDNGFSGPIDSFYLRAFDIKSDLYQIGILEWGKTGGSYYLTDKEIAL